MEGSVRPHHAQRPGETIIAAVKRYGSRLFAFVRGKVRSDQDAEDILQDVWCQLADTIETDEIEQMSGWLYRVAKNKIIDRHRKKSTVSLEEYMYMDDDGAFSVQDILPEGDSNPESEYLREIFWQALFAALDELPENQRQVFISNELEDMTLQEIADKTGEKLKTIISRKGYAVKHLRQRLESLYLELFD